MAGIYDVLRGNFDLGDQQALLDERLQDLGGADVAQQLQQPGIDPATVGAESAYTMRRAGMVPNQQGQLVDPYRNIALSREARLQMALQQDKARREEIADSTLFKVGDTLADTGRMFLSPLFWLKGEDTTKYDPSERLKTGYRNQFDALQSLRETNVEKFLTSRNQRLDAATSLEVSRRNQQIQATSPFEKELQNFAIGDGLQAMYKDPKQRKALTELFRVRKGQAIQFGDTVIDAQLHKTVIGRAEKFETVTSGYRDALQGYSALKASLGSGNAVGNIAAVFTFMKTLDPNSVVREGEFQLAAQAGGLHTKLMSMISNVKTGEFIRPEVAQEMLEVAGEIAKLYEDKYNEKRGRYATEFSKYQYSEEDIKTLLGDEVRLNAEDDQGSDAPPPARPEDVSVRDTTDPADAALAGYLESTQESEVLPDAE